MRRRESLRWQWCDCVLACRQGARERPSSDARGLAHQASANATGGRAAGRGFVASAFALDCGESWQVRRRWRRRWPRHPGWRWCRRKFGAWRSADPNTAERTGSKLRLHRRREVGRGIALQ